jgi:hypothetical protein
MMASSHGWHSLSSLVTVAGHDIGMAEGGHHLRSSDIDTFLPPRLLTPRSNAMWVGTPHHDSPEEASSGVARPVTDVDSIARRILDIPVWSLWLD